MGREDFEPFDLGIKSGQGGGGGHSEDLVKPHRCAEYPRGEWRSTTRDRGRGRSSACSRHDLLVDATGLPLAWTLLSGSATTSPRSSHSSADPVGVRLCWRSAPTTRARHCQPRLRPQQPSEHGSGLSRPRRLLERASAPAGEPLTSRSDSPEFSRSALTAALRSALKFRIPIACSKPSWPRPACCGSGASAWAIRASIVRSA